MKKTIACLLLIFTASELCSQYVVKSQEELLQLAKVPQEKVYLAHTGPLLFSGEYLYYGFYCFNAQNNRQSDISRVGYVALVDQQKEYVIEQKIKLEKGLGQGEFFVSTEVPSGNYKLLGYTQWMKNNGLAQVFKEDIVIINPYLSDQSSLLAESEGSEKNIQTSNKTQGDASTIGFVFDQKEFSPRQKIRLAVRNYKGNLGEGTYSIKVRKKDDKMAIEPLRATAFGRSYLNVDKALKRKVGDSIFLPEQRGELLFGSVISRATGSPMADVPVVVSIPGKEFLLKFATTDAAGNFYSYLRKDYKTPLVVLQVEDEQDDYGILLKKQRKLDVSGLKFAAFQLNQSFEPVIKERSVRNQIENQYFTKKPDSVLLGDPIDPFDGGIAEVINLDDFTRFQTFEETLVEILNKTGYRSNNKGNDYIRILQDFERVDEEYNDFPAIVLIDGVFIPNHERIKTFDAKKIKTIRLIRDQFQLANKQYQGMMSVETFEGDYVGSHDHTNSLVASLELPLAKKNYFNQNYVAVNDTFDRIPDYRTLLFWKPNFTFESNTVFFDFFTSDVAGTYEVLLDGFTTYGKPISISETFEVR